ncbi:MAG: nitrate reductase [Bacteroidetes bacterium CG2_30_33_31]|nr:MAG: nitrate reductase [Bacteroidetes bacterium CG2_30_33_31]
MKTTRRQFIKISGFTAAGAVVAGSVLGSVQKVIEKSAQGNITSDSDLTRTPTYCEVCFWKCGAWVYKDKKGNIKKLVGNANDQHARGKLCPRGTGGLGMYTDKDRLLKPKIRVKNAKGNETFKDVEWDEAISYIADKMEAIDKKYGKEHIALFIHGAPAAHFEYLFKSYGVENSAEPAYAQCAGPREAGFFATFGSGVGSPEPADMQNSKCITFIGNHVGENMHNSFVQEVSTAIDNGASIIVVDPRLSTIAAKTKFWLPIKPGTDIALLLSWIHILIYDNIYNKEYVDKYAYGFDQLKEHVKNYTAEWASAITTIDPNLIRDAVYEMAKAAPASVVHPGRHTTWYGDDTQRERAMAIINALLGAYGSRGGIYMGVKQKLPEYPGVPAFPEPKWTWKEITKDKFKGASVGVTNVLIDASLATYEPEHQIKAWFIAGTSFINSIPDKKKILKAMENQELIVVVDTMPMEMTGYADVVLPECTYLERHDYCRAGKNRIAQVAYREPAVEPKGDSKPAWWIAREIGLKLGLEKYYPWQNLEEVLAYQFEQIGTSLKEMKKLGVKTFESSDPIYIAPGEDYQFNTNTGKIELYSTDFEAMGYDPLPKYTPNEEVTPGFYHFIYGRVPMHTFGRTQNNPYLYELKKENEIWINPKIGKIWDIKNDDMIWLKNQDEVISNFAIKVRLTERIGLDSVYVAHGFGHTSKFLSKAFGKGINDSELITNIKIDPVMGGTGMRANFVTFLTENPKIEEVKS